MILNDEIKRNKCLIKKNTSQQSKHLEKNSENPDHLTNSENSETFSNSISPENVKEPVENDNIKLTNDVQNDNSITEEIKVDISKDSKPLDVAEEKDTQNVINESTIKVENNNVKLSVSDNLEKNVEETDKNDNEVDGLEELNEINLEIPTELEPVHLKNPNEVYLEIYREVKKRAKEAKKKAIEAYLEAKRIKSLYLLDEIESSDDEGELLAITDDV
jgi:hypothetical protein